MRVSYVSKKAKGPRPPSGDAGPPPDQLSQDELAVLKYFVQHRNFAPESAKRLEAIERDLGVKLPDFHRILASLVARGLAASTKKGSAGKTNYYVDPGPSLRILKENGLWSPGRVHRL